MKISDKLYVRPDQVAGVELRLSSFGDSIFLMINGQELEIDVNHLAISRYSTMKEMFEAIVRATDLDE